MKNNKLKKLSLTNVIIGYIMMSAFIVLVLLNKAPDEPLTEVTEAVPEELFNGVTEDVVESIPEKEIVYIDRPTIIDRGVGIDRLSGVIIEDDINTHVAVIGGRDDIYVDTDRRVDIIRDDDTIFNRIDRGGNNIDSTVVGGVHTGHHRDHDIRVVDDADVDIGLLDRRLADHGLDGSIDAIDLNAPDRSIDHDKIGIDKNDDSINLAGLTLAREGDDIELGDLDTDFNDVATKGDYGVGKGGQLYAYDFPSQGVSRDCVNQSLRPKPLLRHLALQAQRQGLQ